MILGEQALYTNVGGPEVIRGQLERLLRDVDLPSLTLGVLPATAEVDIVPMPSFNMYDGGRAHYDLVSTGVDITDPGELALHTYWMSPRDVADDSAPELRHQRDTTRRSSVSIRRPK
ncbi:hypothetical protein GCM10027074_11090 [Streptomyces deserti]